ncbi:CorA family divalent cation transporter [Streptomyces sp. NPDC057474]|uniref:CorA family divalent cation transporter n=1 Tax=Streptomyces sp. NPDC057474 TaxID=3346144 RepID=UPI00368E1F70
MAVIAIAGVYGMNADRMPELRRRFGYPAMLIATTSLVTVDYLVFRKSVGSVTCHIVIWHTVRA